MTPAQLCTIEPASTSQTGVYYIKEGANFAVCTGLDSYAFWGSLQFGSSQWAYSVTATDVQLKQRFNSLVKRWKRETIHFSLIEQMVLHPAYQEIIGLGKKAIPLILKQLKKEPNFWFWALRSLTGKDPVTKDMRGDVMAMRKAWLNWGKDNGYF